MSIQVTTEKLFTYAVLLFIQESKDNVNCHHLCEHLNHLTEKARPITLQKFNVAQYYILAGNLEFLNLIQIGDTGLPQERSLTLTENGKKYIKKYEKGLK